MSGCDLQRTISSCNKKHCSCTAPAVKKARCTLLPQEWGAPASGVELMSFLSWFRAGLVVAQKASGYCNGV